MSFWNESPGPHWSDFIWSCSSTAIVQPIRRHLLKIPVQSDSIQYMLAKPADSLAITEFLSEHFQITKQSVCSLPVERLSRGLQSEWIAVIAKQNERIIGTVISRILGTLIFLNRIDHEAKLSKFSSADYIDFFCVDSQYRNKRVGSELLKYIDFYSTEQGRPIHFFQKELTPLFSLPPLWYGTYIVRSITKGLPSESRIQTFQNQKERGFHTTFSIRISNPRSSQDSRYYINDCDIFKIHLAITNTYHKVKNSWLGEVLFYSVESSDSLTQIKEQQIASAVEDIIEYSGYNYIIMDESVPHLKQFPWVRDAPYYLYAYNVNPRKFFTVKPELWF